MEEYFKIHSLTFKKALYKFIGFFRINPMPTVEERVTNLELIFAKFIEISEKQFQNFDKYIIETQLARQKSDEKMDLFIQEMETMKNVSDKRWNELKVDSENRMEKFDQEMKQLKIDSENRMEKFDQEMKQLKIDSENRMKKFDQEMKQLKIDSENRWNELKKEGNKKYEDLIHKLGTFLEDIVAPNIPRIAKEIFNIGDAQFFSIRAKIKNVKGETREFDAVYISETTFLLNEAKSNPKIEYIDNFINAIENIYDYFPQYKEKHFIPIFSSFHIPENVKKYLTKKKVYGMQIKDDTMEIINFGEIH